METKFNIGEEVYLKYKVLAISVTSNNGTEYRITVPAKKNFSSIWCSEEDLEKVPEVPKTNDYNITLTVPNVTHKDILSIYDKLEAAMNDIVGSDEWGMRGAPIGEEKDDGTGN